MRPCVDILASRANGTPYVGVPSDLARRVWQHRTGAVDGFTKRYEVKRLVYAEFHATIAEAIQREKQLKKWRRAWKVALIEKESPDWRDLYEDLNR